MRRDKKRGIKRLLILAVLSLAILAGCVTCPTMPLKPTKPTLETSPGPDGGICLDGDNTLLLLDYIWKLEEIWD